MEKMDSSWKLLRILFWFGFWGCRVFAHTHWVITEEGKIQAVTDSLFNMVQPHDLVQFLRQEIRVERTGEAQTALDEQKLLINENEELDDPDIEKRLMSDDADCLLAGKPLAQQELFPSSVEQRDIDWDSLILPSKITRFELPVCQNFLNLPFSMATFDHMESVHKRRELVQSPEPHVKTLVAPNWGNVTDWAWSIATAMQMNPKSWQLHNLATFYWRLVGNAYNGVECVRRALYLTPHEFVVIPLVNLGNILHQSARTADAAAVLESAVAINESMTGPLFTLAHIYAVMMEYNKSIHTFDRVLELDPKYPDAAEVRSAVKCHSKLEQSLEEQHESLQNTLDQLQQYQDKLKNFHKLHEQMMNNVADPETTSLMGLVYDHFTYGTLKGLRCDWAEENTVKSMYCEVEDQKQYVADRLKRHEQLQMCCNQAYHKKETSPAVVKTEKVSKQSAEASANSIHGKVVENHGDGAYTVSATVDIELEKKYLASLELKSGWVNLTKPTRTKSYFPAEFTDLYETLWSKKDYIVPEDPCPFIDPELSHIFVPPEHKGFNTSLLFNEYLNLNASFRHPLPWYPPLCSTLSQQQLFHLGCCDHLLGVQKIKRLNKEQLIPESLFNDGLLEFSRTAINVAEVGQRLHSLMNYNIGPQWLVLNLAALYWRGVGVVQEAVNCLRLALHNKSAKTMADVSLIQLSYLVYAAGNRLDDAVVLARQAVEMDETEPMAQYLLGFYLAVKENFTGAEFHLKKAASVQPNVKPIDKLLRSVRCKLSQQRPKKAESPPKSSSPTYCRSPPSADSDDMPKFFCIKEEGEERCYLEESNSPAIRPTLDEVGEEAADCISRPSVSTVTVAPPTAETVEITTSTPTTPAKKVKLASADLNLPTVVEDQSEESQAELSLLDDTLLQTSGDPKPAEEQQPKVVKMFHHSPEGDIPEEEGFPVPNNVHFRVKQKAGERPILEIYAGDETPGDADVVAITSGADSSSPEPPIKPFSPTGEVGVPPDVPLPEILPMPSATMIRAGQDLFKVPTSTIECPFWRNKVKLDKGTSTWLSISAKGLSLQKYIDLQMELPSAGLEEPVCPTNVEGSVANLMDHLNGYIHRHNLAAYRPERGLRNAFESLGGGGTKDTVERMAKRIFFLMKLPNLTVLGLPENHLHSVDKSPVSWVYATLAALYWRVEGNASMAVDCLRYALAYAPINMRDLSLVSLANVYQQSRMLHSALIVAGGALDVSPNFVVVHFTLANIYAAMGDLDRAAMFYYSTLSLQKSFEPARERLKTIWCLQGSLPNVESVLNNTPHQRPSN